jgi:hypothetical protein
MVGGDGFHAGLVFFRDHVVANVTPKDPGRVAPLKGWEVDQMRHFGSALIADADGCGRFAGRRHIALSPKNLTAMPLGVIELRSNFPR